MVVLNEYLSSCYSVAYSLNLKASSLSGKKIVFKQLTGGVYLLFFSNYKRIG